MARYSWRSGTRIKAEAQIVGETLQRLSTENGDSLTARVVVDAARPFDSPLHGCFEWDDLRAAELFRETQARHVISSIRVLDNERGSQTVTRVFVNVVENVGDDLQRRYVPLARVATDADLYRQVLNRAANDLRAFEDRYAQFATIATVARTAREQLESEQPVEPNNTDVH